MNYNIKPTAKDISYRKLEGYLKWAKIIQWGRKNPIGFCENFFGVEFLDVQKWIFMNTWTKPYNLWCICRNGGKALALDMKIPTPNGFKLMRDIQIGDYVLSEQGEPTEVIMVSPIFYGHDCYEITFDDREKIIADKDHLWEVYIDRQKKVITTHEIYNILYLFNVIHSHNIFVPTVNKKYKKIISIKQIPSVPTKCIMVDNPNKLYLCGEKNTITHNSTLVAPFIMAKSILINGHQTYILSNNSSQSQETFMKIEQIAKKQISSFIGLTDFFKGELVTSQANKDGFTHAQTGFKYALFNGSKVTSLSGSIDNNRGKRSNLNVYDESGWTLEEYVSATEPFLAQDENFKLGGNVDVSILPLQIPNQRLFISSASSTDSYFFKLYKDYAEKMLLGNDDYFVTDINCDVMLHPTTKGIYKGPLVKKSNVEAIMNTNREKGLREFYNKFSIDGGNGQVFKRADVIKSSRAILPILSNEGNKKHRYVLAYDPARMHDNSPILVAEIIKDEKKGEMLRICNCIVLRDIKLKKKTPLPIPKQIEKLKEAILKYNGKDFADYENIETILIDSGAGGSGQPISDFLWEDWMDKEGNSHRGLIDKGTNKDYVSRYPNAINKIKLISPKKYKTIMFDSLYEMINQDLIRFPSEYNGRGYINIPVETGKDIVIEKNKNKKIKDKEIEYKKIKLDKNQEIALKNIDLAKEELVHIYRTDNPQHTVHTYALNKEVENKMHDDKAYCLALLGWYLQEVRISHIVNKKKEVDYSNIPYFVSDILL